MFRLLQTFLAMPPKSSVTLVFRYACCVFLAMMCNPVNQRPPGGDVYFRTFMCVNPASIYLLLLLFRLFLVLVSPSAVSCHNIFFFWFFLFWSWVFFFLRFLTVLVCLSFLLFERPARCSTPT